MTNRVTGRVLRGAVLGAILAVLLAAPLGAQPAPNARREALDTALSALRAAPDEQTSGRLQADIRRQWVDMATPAIKLLMLRAQRNLQANDPGSAFDDYEAVLDLDGNLLEGWRGRAQARFRLGDGQGAVRDIQEVLRREPRHFGALEDLSRIAEARGDFKGALAAWQKVLDIAPRTPDGQARLQELRRRAYGQEL